MKTRAAGAPSRVLGKVRGTVLLAKPAPDVAGLTRVHRRATLAVRGPDVIVHAGGLSNAKMSGSGMLPGLSCIFCMAQDVCNARPSITDF